MPKWSVIFIRTALFYLLIGSLAGGIILLAKANLLNPRLQNYLPVHVETVLIGWIIHLVIGVAYWMLPRYSREPFRGSLRPVIACFVLLNLGLLMVVFASIATELTWLAFAGRILEFAGVAMFALHAWPRIKPFADTV